MRPIDNKLKQVGLGLALVIIFPLIFLAGVSYEPIESKKVQEKERIVKSLSWQKMVYERLYIFIRVAEVLNKLNTEEDKKKLVSAVIRAHGGTDLDSKDILESDIKYNWEEEVYTTDFKDLVYKYEDLKYLLEKHNMENRDNYSYEKSPEERLQKIRSDYNSEMAGIELEYKLDRLISNIGNK